MAVSLIITGFMGSGKTTVARELAGSLGWRFRDADDEAERRMGMTIREAFERIGEKGFREVEEEVVMGLLDEPAQQSEGTVIALGGGAVTSDRIRRRLADEPLVIFIDVDVDTAYDRAADGTRPLAADRQQFEQLFRQRQELYRSVAARVVESRGLDVNALGERIREIVEEGDVDNP